MSDLTLSHNARLTDSLERELLRGAMEDQSNTIRPLAAVKTAAAGVGRGVRAVFAFIDEVNESMNRARAQSAHYTGSQW
ncbi:hypothetical protein L506_4724 [Bordetella bronchiseptica GA96-01]|uniref:hypothetical protein n=1 Tax=Bordetella bronchiseptica TaxID=518 RepID=UPI00045B6AD3|nr:hypothetical protein [Bordetella bronchiseptica]AZW32944.1 hypothetical protein CS343_22835 [Bordetella bronchiseptica]KCV42099.1 hypothetical protein L572_4733 [Bordetella bronchiseptica 345]KDC34484.1 hypothetical protein L506_4724 [Bordetella bronchiseptica GA96-01]